MAEYDCRSCKMWKGCPGKDWYHYGEIRWCVWQIIWILANRVMLHSGDWPKDPHGSEGDNLGRRQIKTEASYTKSIVTIAEVDDRLKQTGTQAELLITQIEDGRTFDNLSNGAMEVLMYVKGKDRKETGFKKWLRQVYYAPKTGGKEHLVGQKPTTLN